MKTLLVLVVMLGLAMAHWNCWWGCNKRSGRCYRCPTGGNFSGMCCRRGWTQGGCRGIQGCYGYHCCVLGDCWHACGRRGGRCGACADSNKACCRKGWTRDPIECGKGIVGCSGYHCCVKQATTDQICGSNIDKNWKLVNMKYDIGRGTISDKIPKVAGSQYIDNSKGTGSQTVSFQARESYSTSQSFTHTTGASITVGTEFKCGIPILAEGKFSVDVTASYEFSYGTTKTETKSKWATYKCTAPPGKRVTCKVLYNEFKASVPYIATWERINLSQRCRRTTRGIFKEVSAFEMHMHVNEARVVVEVLEKKVVL